MVKRKTCKPCLFCHAIYGCTLGYPQYWTGPGQENDNQCEEFIAADTFCFSKFSDGKLRLRCMKLPAVTFDLEEALRAMERSRELNAIWEAHQNTGNPELCDFSEFVGKTVVQMVCEDGMKRALFATKDGCVYELRTDDVENGTAIIERTPENMNRLLHKTIVQAEVVGSRQSEGAYKYYRFCLNDAWFNVVWVDSENPQDVPQVRCYVARPK